MTTSLLSLGFKLKKNDHKESLFLGEIIPKQTQESVFGLIFFRLTLRSISPTFPSML